ncbi:Alpha-2-macroglobulin-like protein 1 [Nymphon striatum]|nr:Alpha-2-macroglobulin-like protein 1 [Nymphon striatum]
MKFVLAALVCLVTVVVSKAEKGYLLTAPKVLDAGSSERLCLILTDVSGEGQVNVKLLQTKVDIVIAETTITFPRNDTCFFLAIPNVKYSEGRIQVKGEFKDDDYSFESETKVAITTRSAITFIQTDKAIYKPSQKVQFRILTVNYLLEPVSGVISKVFIQNPNGIRVAQWLNVSNSNGLVQLDMQLSEEPALGFWKINAEVHGQTKSQKFEVGEYVLPDFSVTITPPKYLLANAESATWKVCARYSYGKGVQGKMKFEIKYKTYRWDSKDYPSSKVEEKINGCYDVTVYVNTMKWNEKATRYRELEVTAEVEEDGTGAMYNAEHKMQIGFNPFEMKFKSKEDHKNLKPGLPFFGQIYVSKPDMTPAGDETIEVCYRSSRERHSSSDTSLCKNYTSSPDGLVDYVVPPQKPEILVVSIDAKGAKYPPKYAGKENQSKLVLRQPFISHSLTPWYSPSGSFLDIEPIVETISCDKKVPLNIRYTTDGGNITVHYQVMSRGRIVAHGTKTHSYVDGEYKENDSYITQDEARVKRQTNFEETVNYTLPAHIGQFTLDLDITPDMAPTARVLLFYIRPDNEAVAAHTFFDVKPCFNNKATLKFKESSIYPGTNAKYEISAAPNSICAVAGVDKKVHILRSDNQLTSDKVFNVLKGFDAGRNTNPVLVNNQEYCKKKLAGKLPTEAPTTTTKDQLNIRPPWYGDSYSYSSNYVDALTSFDPNGFHGTIHKRIETLVTLKKHVPVGSDRLFDIELIYSRIIGVQASARNLNLQDLFSYELAPVPTSMFKDSGAIRFMTDKVKLKRLQVETSVRTILIDATVIDGSALLWIPNWPTKGTVADLIAGFKSLIEWRLRHGDGQVWYLPKSPSNPGPDTDSLDPELFGFKKEERTLQTITVPDNFDGLVPISNFILETRLCQEAHNSYYYESAIQNGEQEIFDDERVDAGTPILFSQGGYGIDPILILFMPFMVFGGIVPISNFDLETRLCEKLKQYYNYQNFAGGDVLDDLDSPVRESHFGYASSGASGNTIPEESGVNDAVEIREYFPETWLWDLEVIGKDGTLEKESEIPHSITEWVGSMFCTSADKGLGVSPSAYIKAFQPFFASFSLPYSVVRKEKVPILVSVFNYLSGCIPVKLTLEQSDFYDISGDRTHKMCVCSKPGVHSFKISPTGLGEVNLTVYAHAFNDAKQEICGKDKTVSTVDARDTVINPLIVEPEGFPQEVTQSVLFCPSEHLGGFNHSFELSLPDDLVPGSERAYLSISGDIMGPSLSGLEKLVALPTGCGEQNMILFAPNIFVMQYLKGTSSLTDEIEKKSLQYMKIGYQRELNYRHSDGSYSAFGESDKEGSSWLTAFVIKSFAQANEFIEIDPVDLKKSTDWLLSKQQTDGCFPFIGMGGVGKGVPTALTAYIMISLLESKTPMSQEKIDKAFNCIAKQSDPNSYTLGLTAYAAVLAGKTDLANELLNKLYSRAINEGTSTYWKTASKSVSVELGAYVILTLNKLKTTENQAKALNIVRWVARQRNANGGFVSTQDTVIALQAFAEYAIYQSKATQNLKVTAEGGEFTHNYNITKTNRLLMQTDKIENLETEFSNIIEVMATGEGCGLAQATLKYNKANIKPEQALSLSVEGIAHDWDCKKRTIKVCASYNIPGENSNMALVTVKMVSGYIPDKKSLKNLKYTIDDFKRYEVDKNFVNIYFDYLNQTTPCFKFDVIKEIDVEDAKPATVTVFDYYVTELKLEASYELPEVKCVVRPPHIEPLGPFVPIDPIDPIDPLVLDEDEPEAVNATKSVILPEVIV